LDKKALRPRDNKEAHELWSGMIERVNGRKINKRRHYSGCSVAEEWHNFQNFAAWYYENFKSEWMDKWCLDKDILVKGNKVYSPETCAFVPQEINKLFIKRDSMRGEYPVGVYKNKGRTPFSSKLNTGRGVVKYLGVFHTPKEAFEAYKTAKEEYIKEVAEKWKGQIDKRVYQAMINYKVEIED